MLTSSKHKTYEENNPKTHCSQVIQNQLFKKKILKVTRILKRHIIYTRKKRWMMTDMSSETISPQQARREWNHIFKVQ